jgi:DNA-binding NarL/FixJ family response regulator
MDVVGEVATARRLRSQVRAHRPDLLVVDWALVAGAGGAARSVPPKGGAESWEPYGLRAPAAATLAALRRSCPGLHILVLSLRPEDRRAALAAGADAFVSKVEAPDHLVQALRAARPRRRSGAADPGPEVAGCA